LPETGADKFVAASVPSSWPPTLDPDDVPDCRLMAQAFPSFQSWCRLI
jgi:hypothetical protein